MPRKKQIEEPKETVDVDGGRPTRNKRAPKRLEPGQSDRERSVERTPTRRKRSRSRSATPKRSSSKGRERAAKRRGPGRPPKKSRDSSRSRSRSRSRGREEDKEYEVEAFIDMKLLVKWKGYPKSAATWEPFENLAQGCPQMVLDHLDKLREDLRKQMDEQEEQEEEAPSEKEEEETPSKADVLSTPKRGRPQKSKGGPNRV